jgi:hypothetical protein
LVLLGPGGSPVVFVGFAVDLIVVFFIVSAQSESITNLEVLLGARQRDLKSHSKRTLVGGGGVYLLVSAGGVYLLVVVVFLVVGAAVVFGVLLIVDVGLGSGLPGNEGMEIEVGRRTVVGG